MWQVERQEGQERGGGNTNMGSKYLEKKKGGGMKKKPKPGGCHQCGDQTLFAIVRRLLQPEVFLL